MWARRWSAPNPKRRTRLTDKPPLALFKYGYNLLLHALYKNAANGYGTGLFTTPAAALIEKIENGCRLCASPGGTEYAEIPLSGEDAAGLIWQLVCYAASLDIPHRDFYALLKAKREAIGGQ